MKKIFLLISLVFCSVYSVAMAAENCLNAKLISYTDDGAFYQNKPYTGCAQAFYDNGKMHFESHFKNGLGTGDWPSYTEEGILSTILKMKNGKNISLLSYYPNGKVESEFIFPNAEGFSFYKKYYPNGNLKEEGRNNANDKQDGVAKFYYENGTLKGENTYKDDKLNGKFTKYYEDGKLHVVGNYKDNKLDGEQIIYYPDGSIKKKGTFKDDKEIYQTRNIVIDQEVSIGGKYIPEKGENRPVSVESRQESKTITAIVVDSVPSEYEYLDQEYSGYRLIQQALIIAGEVPMDVLTIETADGEEKEIYFDISSFYGNYEKILSGEK